MGASYLGAMLTLLLTFACNKSRPSTTDDSAVDTAGEIDDEDGDG